MYPFKRTRFASVAAVFVISLGGCAIWVGPVSTRMAVGPADHAVYVVQRGHHTDIGLMAADLSGPLSEFRRVFPASRSILFGFGDRTFITTRRKWAGDWLLALLPGEGAILVTGLRTDPDTAFGAANVVRLQVSAAQLAGVEAYLGASFAYAQGAPKRIGNGPYLGSMFYASPRGYDLLDTCNTWTAASLRAGGLAEPVDFTLFATQAMRGARRLSAGD
jgi:uncharacterized protein (TIGR02117 family)